MKTDFQNKADFSPVIKFIFNSEKQKSRLNLKSLNYPSKWLQFLFAMVDVCLMTSASKFLQSHYVQNLYFKDFFVKFGILNLTLWIYFYEGFFCLTNLKYLNNSLLTCWWHQKNEFKVLQKRPESLLKPFLMLYHFLFITLKNTFSLAFSF